MNIRLSFNAESDIWLLMYPVSPLSINPVFSLDHAQACP